MIRAKIATSVKRNTLSLPRVTRSAIAVPRIATWIGLNGTLTGTKEKGYNNAHAHEKGWRHLVREGVAVAGFLLRGEEN